MKIIQKIIIVAVLAVAVPALQGLFGAGSQCYAQKDPDAVMAAMTELIHHQSTHADTIAVEISKRFKKSAPMQVALARAYYRNNERTKTRFYINKAIAADPKYVPAYALCGDMFAEWETDSAATWYNRAVEANPQDPTGYIRYANLYARTDFEKAKAKLEELRVAVPTYNVDLELAAIYNSQGDDKAAIEAMQKVNINSLSVSQIAQYLLNCYWGGNDTQGIEVAKVATKRFPEINSFHRLYSWCAARSGNYDDAIREGDKWFSVTPVDSLNSIDFLSMGVAYLDKNSPEKAFEYFERIKYLKNDPFASQMEAQIRGFVNKKVDEYKNAGKYDEAGEVYKLFIDKYPSKADPAYQYYALAQIYRDQQEELNGAQKIAAIKKMFEYYDIIEKKYPDWTNIHYVLYIHARWTYSYFDPDNEQQLAEPYYTKLYEKLKDKSELNDQQKAMIIESCQYLASTEYFQRKDVTKARQWWNMMLKYDPDNETAQKALKTLKK